MTTSYDRWMEAYEPEDDAEMGLVEQLILNKWFLQRNERRYPEVEAELAAVEFASWTDQHHKKFQLALRYKTTAERSVTRAVQELELQKKKRGRQDKEHQRRDEKRYAHDLKHAECIFKNEADFMQKIAKAELLGVNGPRSGKTTCEGHIGPLDLDPEQRHDSIQLLGRDNPRPNLLC